MKIIYGIECLPEHTSVRGNAIDTGNDADDREIEDRILADLESGNDWAWCTVRVTASVTLSSGTTIEGEAFLGCCSYDNQADFEEGGYLPQMQDEARADLESALRRVALDGKDAARLLEGGQS